MKMRDIKYEDDLKSDSVNPSQNESLCEVERVGMFGWVGQFAMDILPDT